MPPACWREPASSSEAHDSDCQLKRKLHGRKLSDGSKSEASTRERTQWKAVTNSCLGLPDASELMSVPVQIEAVRCSTMAATPEACAAQRLPTSHFSLTMHEPLPLIQLERRTADESPFSDDPDSEGPSLFSAGESERPFAANRAAESRISSADRFSAFPVELRFCFSRLSGKPLPPSPSAESAESKIGASALASAPPTTGSAGTGCGTSRRAAEKGALDASRLGRSVRARRRTSAAPAPPRPVTCSHDFAPKRGVVPATSSDSSRCRRAAAEFGVPSGRVSCSSMCISSPGIGGEANVRCAALFRSV
mmetsp:Transcript_39718/g.98208  ORF Transcript_39718/g.98208 Transcript_39718/m.98208 type:complete len:308 (-) Transcript_39718:404-1327(-)